MSNEQLDSGVTYTLPEPLVYQILCIDKQEKSNQQGHWYRLYTSNGKTLSKFIMMHPRLNRQIESAVNPLKILDTIQIEKVRPHKMEDASDCTNTTIVDFLMIEEFEIVNSLPVIAGNHLKYADEIMQEMEGPGNL